MEESSAQWLELDSKFDRSHRARIVENAVNQLGSQKLRKIYRGAGSLAFPPELMLKMVLFEYLQGRTSPAQWHRDAGEHDAMKWLGRGIRPSRSAWYNFRDRMDSVIHELNDDMIRNALDDGLTSPVDAVQDGTTFRSAASRHQTFNQEALQKRQAKLDAVIEADQQQKPAEEPLPKWIPPTPVGRFDLQRRMEVAGQHLEQKHRENREKPKDKRRPEKNIVVSLTDPVAPFARDKAKTFCFLYTTQFMIDTVSLLILGYSIAAENTDAGTLAPMIDWVQNLVGGSLKRVSVDAGYTSLLDLMDCRDRSIDLLGPVQSNSFSVRKPVEKDSRKISRDDFQWLEDEQTYRCPEGHDLFLQTSERLKRHGGRYVQYQHFRCPPEYCTACPLRERCTTNPGKGRVVKRMDGQELIDRQQEKMAREDVKEIYRKRGQTIERSFADAKSHRAFGKFHGRGLSRSRAEVGLLVMAQNLLNLNRLGRIAETSEKQAD